MTVKLGAKLADDSPLALRLDGLKINGDAAASSLDLGLASTLRIDPAATGPKLVTIPVSDKGLGTSASASTARYEAGEALDFTAGILGVSATGTATADVGVAVRLRDPDGDGVLDLDELRSPAALLAPACVSDGAQVELTVSTDLAGLTGKVGHISARRRRPLQRPRRT